MTILEMKDRKAILLSESRAKLATAKKETRLMSESEQTAFDASVSEVEDLDKKILTAEEELRTEEGKKKVQPVKMKTMDKKFSLLRAIRNRAEGRAFSEEERKVIDAGMEEMRASGINPEGDIILPSQMEQRADILAGTDTAGSEVVSTDVAGILAPLRESLVAVKAGATYLTGLVGDLTIPAYAGTTAAWKGEVAAAADGGGAFSEVAFSPLRLTAYVDISKRFLIQDSASAEALLKQDIVTAVASKLEGTIFSTAAASAGVSPAGIFTGTVTMAGLPTWGDMVSLETTVDTGNALIGNLSYLTNSVGRGLLKTIVKHATNPAGFLMSEGGEMNGYPVHVSNHISTAVNTDEEGIAFANWADLIIAQWGGIDLLVDPYSQATTGQVRLVVNAYFDAKFRRTASLAVGSIAAAD